MTTSQQPITKEEIKNYIYDVEPDDDGWDNFELTDDLPFNIWKEICDEYNNNEECDEDEVIYEEGINWRTGNKEISILKHITYTGEY
tara:strand:+ start:410 stop:670 length:261 start_codon:yes stop_codon:yes gene_type:complete